MIIIHATAFQYFQYFDSYLGITFISNGSISKGVKVLSDQALKAMYNLLSLLTKINVNIKTKLKLFYSLVKPILLYSSEVWGIYCPKEVDNIHIKFCKIILGLKTQTTNYAVLGGLGSIPLSVICQEKSLSNIILIKIKPINV